MNDRIAARAAGVLFITATVAGVISRAAFLSPVLGAPGVLAGVAANETRVLLGALLLVIAALAAPGIAVTLYPVLRKRDRALALGSVGFRLIEGTLYLGIVICLLILVSVAQEAAKAGTAAAAAYALSGTVVLAARDALGLVSVLAFGVGGLMYYTVFYRFGLVPRWLSAWGVLAVVSVMVSSVLALVGLIEPFSPPQIVLALPIGVQEMVLAVWLIVKGFSPVRSAAPEGGVLATRTTATPMAAR